MHVPEAAVNKDQRLILGQNNVGAARKAANVQFVSVAAGVQQFSDGNFRAGVSALNLRHVETALLPSQNVNHLCEPSLCVTDKFFDTQETNRCAFRVLLVKLGWDDQLHLRAVHLNELCSGYALLNGQDMLFADSPGLVDDLTPAALARGAYTYRNRQFQ